MAIVAHEIALLGVVAVIIETILANALTVVRLPGPQVGSAIVSIPPFAIPRVLLFGLVVLAHESSHL